MVTGFVALRIWKPSTSYQEHLEKDVPLPSGDYKVRRDMTETITS